MTYQAGRGLDALVAEKVTGWIFGNPPNYSTDIAAAWEVWSLPAHSGWLMQRYAYEGVEWNVIYSDLDSLVADDPEMILAGAEGIDGPITAAHAICLAALRNKGVKV